MYTRIACETCVSHEAEADGNLSRPSEAPEFPEGGAAGPPTGVGFPQGIFETTLTREDWGDMGGNTTEFIMEIDAERLRILDGASREIGFNGTYTAFRDTIEVSDGVDTVTARWSFDGQRLRFTDVTPENSPFEVVWEAHPWEKTGQQ